MADSNEAKLKEMALDLVRKHMIDQGKTPPKDDKELVKLIAAALKAEKVNIQCEGWRRYGGAFTFGTPVWKQCTNDAIVVLTSQQEKTEYMPACLECWEEAKEKGMQILKTEPIKEVTNDN